MVTGVDTSDRADREQWPSYLSLYGSGGLAARATAATRLIRRCTLCPRECRVDRLGGDLGECRTGVLARVASHGPHFGEERPLVGRGGSGTVFFAGCNLACVFCQNHDISQPVEDLVLRVAARGAAAPGGSPAAPAPRTAAVAPPGAAAPPSRRLRWETPPERLAHMMLELQALGCENINLVSPSHVVPQILQALVLAADGGLRLPLVYNSGGYDSLATLRLLDGVVDIYMPDMKYADASVGERLSGVSDYPARNQAAVLEMHRQVGDLTLDEHGVARRGLLVRHLVLPGGLAGTPGVAGFIAGEVSADTYINVMEQYRIAHRAAGYPLLCGPLAIAEYTTAVEQALAAGLWRLDGLKEGAGP